MFKFTAVASETSKRTTDHDLELARLATTSSDLAATTTLPTTLSAKATAFDTTVTRVQFDVHQAATGVSLASIHPLGSMLI
ncbi:hypothetical protein E8E11_011008 [Didymella keratinophila]|nr:hypothetical protein E8E11_011008 [Didymella keratinophila]